MKQILRFFRPLFSLNYTHPFTVTVSAVLLAVVASYFALQLKIDTDLSNLLPENNEYVLALENLQETVGGETRLSVLIQSPSFVDNKRFAEDLIERSLQLFDEASGNPFFERAYFRKKTELIENNALYFATPAELQTITQYLQDEIEQAKQQANPFYVDFSDEESSDSENEDIDRFAERFANLIPTEYPVSADSTIMRVQFLPAGSQSNLDYLDRMFAEYDSLITAMNPGAYNSQMEVKFGGRLKLQLTQISSIMNDVYRSFASGIGSIILLVMLYFFIKKYLSYKRGSPEDQNHGFWQHAARIPVPIGLIGLPLIISLACAFGITYSVLGVLNTMTSVLFVILFGIGIDYGIHFYARYIEIRSGGIPVKDALFNTYDNTGPAIFTSALTTSFSLLVLVFAQFRGFSEFGFIAGLGILLAMFCMIFVLPALIVLFERWNWILINKTSPEKQKKPLFTRYPFARSVVVVGILISVMVIIFNNQIRFQYDFGELQPETPVYAQFRDIEYQVEQSNRSNPAYILTDTRRQVVQVAEKLRNKMENDTTNSTILSVEALPERFPTADSAINRKLQNIAQIRQLLQDPFIEQQQGEMLETLETAAQTTEPVELSEIPDYFTSMFLTKSGEVGNFVIVYPSVGLADGRNSIAFKQDVGKVTLESGETFYAASSSIIAAEMLTVLRAESPWMVGATLLMVFLLMLFSFRSLKWTLIGMLPLIVGFLWLFGIMILTGIMFNLYNLVVLPAMLGIGEDNGVHMVHRYRYEERGNIWKVLSSTGQHISIASFTTILGFAGLMFTDHPGLQSLGMLAVIGISMTLLAAVTFLPALIQWLEDKEWV